ncbi:MAG TPA: lysophospholipid acyltransferase family protein [Bacillota bacterium]|nr:lysophospholipid acyltransferase family protein [Bacillota bacterium]HPT88060.1 lysophospholipid acyltransferase family protein [Bacillota bacterium]
MRKPYLEKIKINIAYFLVALLGHSLRFRVVGQEQLERFLGKEGFIINCWHGQQLMGFYFFRKRGYYILVSRSRDGDLASGIMERFGWKTIRGSSSKGAVRGLIELLRALRQGAGVALTPDGPRGPIYHVEPGGLYLAEKTGAPLIPMAFVFDRKWISKESWDLFVIPKPFSRCVVYFGEPIFIKDELTEDRLELEKERLQKAIHEANRRGEEVLKEWLS